MPASDILLALLVQGLWGMNFIAAKVGVDTLPPLMFTALRFVIVAILVLPFVRRPRGRAWWGVLALSVTFGTLHFGIMFSALSQVDAATAAVVIQTGPPFSTLLGVLIFREAIGWRRILGLVLAFSGIVVVAGEPHLPAATPVLMLLASAFAWAVSNALVKKTANDLPAVATTGWLCLLAVPQLALLSWWLEDGHAAALQAASWQGWLSVLYTAIGGSLVAHSLWYALMRRHPMSLVAPWGLLAPILGIAAGILVLGEVATWQKFVGGAITLTGVAIIQIRSAGLGRALGAAPETTVDPAAPEDRVPDRLRPTAGS